MISTEKADVMPQNSIGQLEAQISEAMIKFEIEHMGRGPKRARTYILDEMIVVRLESVLTPAEHQLAKDPEGVRLIKQMRQSLIESSKTKLKAIIRDITKLEVNSMHADISARTGERILVFTLQKIE
jgi:uncharacterized protein YbcI